jgi:type IV pilus assembly protein PilX
MIQRSIMKKNFETLTNRKHQQGAVLIVGLLLLVIITILAVSGMNTATTELAMARNDQTRENAFQAAETGIESALSQGVFTTMGDTVVTPTVTTHETVIATVSYTDEATFVPDRAFSLGSGSGVAAYHFIVTSQAAYLLSPGDVTDRDASATHTQAFYVVGPGSPTL